MNLGVFIFTVARLFSWRSAVSLGFLTIFMPFIMGFAPSSGHGDLPDSMMSSLFDSIMPMIIGYIIVADNVANSKNLNDGEYLSLLFTRPITRASYVITKWIAGTCGVALCVYVAYSSFLLGGLVAGHTLLFDSLELINILLNCLSAVALVVLLSTIPLRLGLFILIAIFYISGLGPLFTSASIKATTSGQASAAAITYAIGSVLTFLQSLVHQQIHLNEIFNSLVFSWKPIVTYLSNMTIYLFLAIWIMNKREFYYASE